ncbi:hypothetical protein TD95_001442 [Thielaviopsis punctulata]|uniref:Nucleoporin NUP53 n=1 Tax=Thielaviopsis punctulata TaxID=72032 RepID=A0A0F4ZCG7_9PEZI|nr:hypothetical protein TD95_001442 [Thielaviopsis punctulata]
MAPLILHNVPDEELYVGEDGIQRPYAMLFSQQEGGVPNTRNRRTAPETGSFGKSNRRSRPRTGTPRRERDNNPTQAVADKIFGEWMTTQVASSSSSATTTTKSRRPSGLAKPDDSLASAARSRSQPTEMMLRGYRNSTQQYAAIAHFEQLAGRICEDYPRQAPLEQRRYRSELTDPSFARRRPLTLDERAKVNMVAGGEHWVKVTFESAEAAEIARAASPQNILGFLVSAEPWCGVPPAKDEAAQDLSNLFGSLGRSKSVAGPATAAGPGPAPAATSSSVNPFLKRATAGAGLGRAHSMGDLFDSSMTSPSSSHTLDSGTATLDDGQLLLPLPLPSLRRLRHDEDEAVADETRPAADEADGVFCRRIPTARRALILPAEQALLPQQSMGQRVFAAVPVLSWFSGGIVGSAVPRTEAGDFDWVRASLYWKIVWILDAWFRLFGGEIVASSRED